MLSRELILAVLHGETDYDKAKKELAALHARLGTPADRIPEPACEVTAIFRGDGVDPIAVHFSKWDQVAGLKIGQKATLKGPV
jgi:hypothetical protein